MRRSVVLRIMSFVLFISSRDFFYFIFKLQVKYSVRNSTLAKRGRTERFRLEDDDLLVRRGALDILLQSLHVDSVTVKRAQAEDRTILMRAATSVVLRRDLSLNRRLYSWLLGPAENSQQQVEYFKINALELLRVTLRVRRMTICSRCYVF